MAGLNLIEYPSYERIVLKIRFHVIGVIPYNAHAKILEKYKKLPLGTCMSVWSLDIIYTVMFKKNLIHGSK